MSGLRAAVGANDGPALRRAAHTIKGAVAMFGAEAICQDALRLETMGRQNDLRQAASICAAVQRDVELLKRDLGELLRDPALGGDATPAP